MQHNLALGIGLGGQSLADDHDSLAEVRLAWRSANRPGADEPTIHARDLFHCATHGGAQAVLGSNTQLGRIVPGAPADLVLHEAVTILGHEQTTDAERLTALIIQRGGVRSVRDVLIGGRWVVRDGTVLGVDLPTLTAQLTAEAAQIPTAAAQQNATQAQALAPYLRRFYAAWEAELMSD
jgi:cytosine/adenosine deaminase-related metal-dependent hydrolase